MNSICTVLRSNLDQYIEDRRNKWEACLDDCLNYIRESQDVASVGGQSAGTTSNGMMNNGGQTPGRFGFGLMPQLRPLSAGVGMMRGGPAGHATVQHQQMPPPPQQASAHDSVEEQQELVEQEHHDAADEDAPGGAPASANGSCASTGDHVTAGVGAAGPSSMGAAKQPHLMGQQLMGARLGNGAPGGAMGGMMANGGGPKFGGNAAGMGGKVMPGMKMMPMMGGFSSARGISDNGQQQFAPQSLPQANGGHNAVADEHNDGSSATGNVQQTPPQQQRGNLLQANTPGRLGGGVLKQAAVSLWVFDCCRSFYNQMLSFEYAILFVKAVCVCSLLDYTIWTSVHLHRKVKATKADYASS